MDARPASGFQRSKPEQSSRASPWSIRWKRDRLILLAGGNWSTGCSMLLRCGPIPIIWAPGPRLTVRSLLRNKPGPFEAVASSNPGRSDRRVERVKAAEQALTHAVAEMGISG